MKLSVYLALTWAATSASWYLGLRWQLVVLAFAVLRICGTIRTLLQDPYFSDYHVSLNDAGSEGHALNAHETRTEWINMGYWKDTVVFPEACQALAMKLIEAAECQADGVVLDVGHGCGDSLLLHLEHSAVPRPRHLMGITSQHYHYMRAVERTTHRNPRSVNVELYEGDAVLRSADPLHPLDHRNSNTFTSILALDCAYHFDTRQMFLERAFDCLAPGGRIALADICFAPRSLSMRTKVEMSMLGTMPWCNMITTDEYTAALRAIGYVDVVLEDISAHVFAPFVGFLKTRGVAFRLFAASLDRLVARGMRFVIVSAGKPTM